MPSRSYSLLLAVIAVAAALAGGAGAAASRETAACGLPDGSPLWIEYGEGSLKPDVRAVFMKPGVVVATSGTGAIPTAYRTAGAATMYFELHLPRLVGDTDDPADASTIIPAADALYDKAVKTTTCATPWIALNELQGSQAAMPWTPTYAAYRANVLTLMQRLAARGAIPALLVHGNPTFAGDTATWWHTASQSGHLIYEAYYDAAKMHPLGSLVAGRRMRLGMRNMVTQFEQAGVSRSHIGFMLGFHSALTPGVAGRQGLEPTEAWLRVVKWEALAARQIAAEYAVPSVWSWGWGTFGPESVDADKAAAACTWLWTRDPALCDAPAMAGPAFSTSRVEGQIVVPKGVTCTFAGGRVWTRAVDRLARLTKDRHAALTAQFARAVLESAAPVSTTSVLAVERGVVARSFKGNVRAYARALARAGADTTVARGVIADELRRQAIAKTAGDVTVFDTIAARESRAADTAICLRDEMPGTAEPLSVGNALDVGTVPLAARLPFLFRDHTAPATPVTPTVARTGQTVTLSWPSGAERDLAGYDVYRTVPGGVPQKVNVALVGRSKLVDTGSLVGTTYALRAVDTSANASALSDAASS